MDLLETRFYLGRASDQVSTAITTITCRGIGFLGHVYTEVAHRGRGECFVFPTVMDDLRRRGARAIYLTTVYGTTPYRIYGATASSADTPKSGEMEWFAESEAAFNRLRSGRAPATSAPYAGTTGR